MGVPLFGANSRLDADTLTVTSENTSFPKANLTDDRVFTVFKPATNVDPLDIITDTGGAGSVVDYFGIVGHDLSTQSVTITFASSADNVTYTTIFATTPTTDKIIFRSFTSVTNRFFRLRITGQTAIPSIGEVAWGKRVEPPFAISFRGFDPQAEEVNMRINRSQSGNILGSIFAFAERSARVRIPLTPDSFLRDNTLGGFLDFWDTHAGIGKPFFFLWCKDCNFDQDAFFGVIEPGSRINRPLRTSLSSGFRDLDLEVIGLKE